MLYNTQKIFKIQIEPRHCAKISAKYIFKIQMFISQPARHHAPRNSIMLNIECRSTDLLSSIANLLLLPCQKQRTVVTNKAPLSNFFKEKNGRPKNSNDPDARLEAFFHQLELRFLCRVPDVHHWTGSTKIFKKKQRLRVTNP